MILLSDFGQPVFPENLSQFSVLAPEYAALEQELGSIPKFDLRSLSPLILRRMTSQTIRNSLNYWPKINGLDIKDTIIPVNDRDPIPIRIYTPQTNGLNFHGGGWIFGDLDRDDIACKFVSKYNDVIVISVDYRLAPENPFPAAIEDAILATEWVRDHSKDLRSNGKLGLMGNSAGANLAIVVAYTKKFKNELFGIFLTVPVTCHPMAYPQLMESHEQGNDMPLLDNDGIDAFYDLYGGTPWDRRVSVLLEDDVSWLPPTYIRVCGADPLRDEGIAYAKKLHDNGVKVTLDIYGGYPHSFYNFLPQLKESVKAHERMIEVIKWNLNQ